jgi:ribosomal-protein-alanine N-acetyltransferase
MNIRPFTIYDASILAEIHKQSMDVPWAEQEFLTLLQTPVHGGWMVIINDQAVGFIMVSLLAPDAEILTFCVLPEWRKQQIGQKLLQHFLTSCRHQIHNIFLEVAENNQSAINLYVKCGFKQIGMRKNYYYSSSNASINAVVMRYIRNET